jgi:hypothetical protein
MIPSSLIPLLAMAADNKLMSVLQNGARGQARPSGEVGYVAAVVRGGVPAIARAWQPILEPAGYQLVITGVFCHQAPQATFTDSSYLPATCELADLLVVIDELNRGAVGRRYATLIQAKMADFGGGKTINGKMAKRQLHLFEHWPTFTLPAGYDQAPRDFSSCRHPGKPIDCGRYGLITKHPRWNQQKPASSMPGGGTQLGSFFAKMVEDGQTGYGREATGTGDDWSRTVDELMTVTYANVFNYARGFGPGNPQPRGQTACAFTTQSWPSYLDDDWNNFHLGGDIPPPSGPLFRRVEEGPPPGDNISVLRIGIIRED